MQRFFNKDGKEIRPAVTVGELRLILTAFPDSAQISCWDVASDMHIRGFFLSQPRAVAQSEQVVLLQALEATDSTRDEDLKLGDEFPATKLDAEGDLVLDTGHGSSN